VFSGDLFISKDSVCLMVVQFSEPVEFFRVVGVYFTVRC
jgi:hypothetical protein